jgi:hypothetical protein
MVVQEASNRAKNSKDISSAGQPKSVDKTVPSSALDIPAPESLAVITPSVSSRSSGEERAPQATATSSSGDNHVAYSGGVEGGEIVCVAQDLDLPTSGKTPFVREEDVNIIGIATQSVVDDAVMQSLVEASEDNQTDIKNLPFDADNRDIYAETIAASATIAYGENIESVLMAYASDDVVFTGADDSGESPLLVIVDQVPHTSLSSECQAQSLETVPLLQPVAIFADEIPVSVGIGTQTWSEISAGMKVTLRAEIEREARVAALPPFEALAPQKTPSRGILSKSAPIPSLVTPAAETATLLSPISLFSPDVGGKALNAAIGNVNLRGTLDTLSMESAGNADPEVDMPKWLMQSSIDSWFQSKSRVKMEEHSTSDHRITKNKGRKVFTSPPISN